VCSHAIHGRVVIAGDEHDAEEEEHHNDDEYQPIVGNIFCRKGLTLKSCKGNI